VSLAVFNLLPVPVLDGGHMVFATVARLRGRALPANFVMTTQSVFFALILFMFVYVSISDVRRWARDVQEDHAAEAAGK
jgi:regulator of sigma E protease